ncbi:MAG: GTPase ObgE [Synechococcales cyanobacterium]
MQFIDQATITVQAGNGGDGIVSWRREKYVPAGGPAGGNGGRGGSVYLRASHDLQTLLDFRFQHLFKAPSGQKGGPNNMTGAGGDDLILDVPCGTVITDVQSGSLMGDLTTPGQLLLVAKGGNGGMGNAHFLSNRNRAPHKTTTGKPGDLRELHLELKLIAEVGIIGLPNAGKSTLLSVLSSARPKIADYPFTTLVPNLGVVQRPFASSGPAQRDGVVFADIPGLIEGAHAGVGLGHDFLRHIERTRVLIHLIDVSQEDPVAAYETIQTELHAYSAALADKPQMIVLNKQDAADPELFPSLTDALQNHSSLPVTVISAVTGEGLEAMLTQVWTLLESAQPEDLTDGDGDLNAGSSPRVAIAASPILEADVLSEV